MRQRPPRALCGAAALLLAACAPSDQRAAAGDGAAPPAASAPSAPNEVTVRAADFAYEAPARIPAGMTTFRLANDGPNFHHMQIVRLDGAKTFADLQQALRKPGPLPGWAVVVGGPNAPDPKTEANATLDMRPGRYALVCFVDVPGGVPHLAKGMIKELTVTPAAGGATVAAAPAPDVVLTLRDYQFDLSKPLARGRQTIEVRTAPNTQPHEVELMRLAPGKTAEQMLAWLEKPEGPPPGQGLGGVAATVPESTNYFTADLTPGSYLLICFLPDAKDGKPHFVHGMTKTVTVS
jgi:CubicO group peptidase (beta-lactamase class C family)